MFTGIVEEAGEVAAVEDGDGGTRLRIAAADVARDLDHGQSVSVDGACLTVESFGDGWFEVFLSAETRAKTALGERAVGDLVNLERALPADGRFDGHFVQGHVDTTTELLAVREIGEDWEYEFAVPESLDRYVVGKGFVALDGISLTVADRDADAFTVAIIPTTRDLTNLSEKGPGDRVNVEADVIAKYTERLLAESRA